MIENALLYKLKSIPGNEISVSEADMSIHETILEIQTGNTRKLISQMSSSCVLLNIFMRPVLLAWTSYGTCSSKGINRDHFGLGKWIGRCQEHAAVVISQGLNIYACIRSIID